MGSTTMYAAFDDGDFIEVASFKNPWHGAWVIWNYIARKYSGIDFPLHDTSKAQKIWDLADDPKVNEDDRLALMTTFDYAVVGPKHAERVAVALESIPNVTENILCQAKELRKAFVDGAMAVGWQQTSVSSNLWYVPAKEEDVEGRPYNLGIDTKHLWIIPRT